MVRIAVPINKPDKPPVSSLPNPATTRTTPVRKTSGGKLPFSPRGRRCRRSRRMRGRAGGNMLIRSAFQTPTARKEPLNRQPSAASFSLKGRRISLYRPHQTAGKTRQDTRKNHTKPDKNTTGTDPEYDAPYRANAGQKDRRWRQLDPGIRHKAHQYKGLASHQEFPRPSHKAAAPSTDPQLFTQAPFQPFSVQSRHQETPMNRTALAPTPQLWQ
jgi:hypothetical protein